MYTCMFISTLKTCGTAESNIQFRAGDSPGRSYNNMMVCSSSLQQGRQQAALRTLLEYMQTLIEPLRDIAVWMRSLPRSTNTTTWWSTDNLPGSQRFDHRPMKSHVRLGTGHSLFEKNIAIDDSHLYQAKHHLPPPFDSFSDRACWSARSTPFTW